MPEWQTLFTVLRENDIIVSLRDMPRPVGGGDISAAWRIKTEKNSVFLKTGPADSLAMFQAEADGLRKIMSKKDPGRGNVPFPKQWPGR